MNVQLLCRTMVSGICRGGWGRLLISSLASLGLLAGCATEVERQEPAGSGMGDRYGPGYPPGSAAWSPEARTAFRNAFVNGMADQKEGYRYDEDRGAMVLDTEVRGFYRQGYRRGYYHETVNRPVAATAPDPEPFAGQENKGTQGTTGAEPVQ
jgi:hypothetical protein